MESYYIFQVNFYFTGTPYIHTTSYELASVAEIDRILSDWNVLYGHSSYITKGWISDWEGDNPYVGMEYESTLGWHKPHSIV